MPERQCPYIPDDLLQRPDFIRACAERNLGEIFRLSVKWAGFSKSLISRRCELGISRVSDYIGGRSQARSLDVIERVSDGLHIPSSMLGLGRQPWEVECAGDQTPDVGSRAAPDPTAAASDPAAAGLGDMNLRDTNLGDANLGDMNRRELLRALAVMSTLIVVPPALDGMSERLPRAAEPLDLAEQKAMNGYLWRVYSMSSSKRAVYPVVRQQLEALRTKLEKPHSTAAHIDLCALIGDLLQLAGEISFDGNHYTEAAHCYALAISAGKEAKAYDLWACALSRHALISMHERQFAQTASILAAAARVADRGDKQLSTRHWVATLQAQAYAGLGDLEACDRALDLAATVHHLSGEVHNGGWLRFDGSRLAEESGSCYVQLGRHDLAHEALTSALSQKLSLRRQGSVLSDLALSGVQRRDVDQVLHYGSAALELVKHTDSGYVEHKLEGLQAGLHPLLSDRRVSELSGHITAAIHHA